MRIILRIVVFLYCTPLFAQSFSNQWINYSQPYYSFPITENGLYRIGYQDLLNAGIQVDTLNPKYLQLFAKGEEIPIYVNGEADNSFDLNDYIEFYGDASTAWLDSFLYQGARNQANPYYSLITDTIHYFLSWNTQTNNLRYQEENAIDFSNYLKASYVWKEQLEVYSSSYYDGEILTAGITDPEYVPSEGWLDFPLSLGRTYTKTLNTKNRYASGPFVDFEAQFAGESNWGGFNQGDHHIRLSIGSETIDTIFEGYQLINIKKRFTPSSIISGDNSVKYQSINDQSEVDRSALAYLKITYPHTMSFSNASYFEFLLDNATNQSAQYLEILLFRGGSNAVLYDLTNAKKIRLVETLSNHKMIIPNGSGRKKCVIANPNEIKSITHLKAVGINGFFTHYLDLQSDTTFLIITQTDLIPEASFYAAYRRSQGVEALVVDVEQLYHQYSYGIKKHPLAIRNFIEEFEVAGDHPLSHIFLLGKSIAAKAHRKSELAYLRNLVPTMGNPASDNLMVAGIKGSDLAPIAAVGRLSAKSGNDIDNYLNKVKEYETAQPDKWMKRALHFAGGKSTSEANRYENFLNGYAQSFQSAPLGGQTQLFRKSTSSPFQVTLSDSIRTLINEGVSLLTFFGHSTANGGFDISIDSPDKLENRGKYHVLFANSCFAGNTHQYGAVSTSERYVLEKNKGSIAFIASGNLGIPGFLNNYSTIFYKHFSNKNYGKSLAENMKFAVEEIEKGSVSAALKSICLEMTLQGDPAIALYPHAFPDYRVEEKSVALSPSEITTDLDSFEVSLLIENIGKAVGDSLVIQLIRNFPIGGVNDTVINRTLASINYEKRIKFSFPINVLTDIGSNSFTLLIDPFGSIKELSELNNRLDFNVLVRSGEIIPVYPYNHAIIGDQSPTLKASTAFAFEKEKNYRFELDTSLNFSSAATVSFDVQSKGGVISWQPTQLSNMPDSAVYFWRSSKIPLGNEDFNWRTSSFQYIPNETGWSQDHFDQFRNNEFLFIEQNNEQFEFADNVKELSVVTMGTPSVSDRNRIFYAVDADIRERASCFNTPAILIAVLDSLTLDSWQSTRMDYNHANFEERWCYPNRDRAERVFSFQVTDTNQLFAMRDFLNNEIPKGSYIVAYNYLNIDYSAIHQIDSSILKAFANLGSTIFQDIDDHHPFIFSVKKGSTNSVVEVKGNSTVEQIDLKRILRTNATFGEISSTKIGPSSNFSRLSYRVHSLESNSQDEIEVQLIGVRSDGKSEPLYSSRAFALDTNINALVRNTVYKSLMLKATLEDQGAQTPAQIDRWQINYDELADAAFAPNLLLNVKKDSIQQGENFEIELGVVNNSKVDMDSLIADISVLGSNQTEVFNQKVPLSTLKADSLIPLKLSIPSQSLIGANTLFLTLNPDQNPAEQHTFNNIAQYNFYVSSDKINPLLDVTFDGKHILNQEIVSSRPTIEIRLKDNNKFLALDDTAAFIIKLRYPNGRNEQLSYNNPNHQLQFIPASLPNNTAKALLKPNLNEDGIYRLSVQAVDRTGNRSGNRDYQVEFEIVNQSTVTHLLNYPNPFSTSTQFVFTLTGSEIPDQILIQIMTVTGKVVREINQDELGPIRIGNNISQFKWNGRDEFGDQLANGVYLYRVRMKIKGTDIERRESNVDQYFTKDFGKMYLLR